MTQPHATTSPVDSKLQQQSREALLALRAELQKFLMGKDRVVDIVLCSLLASGHLLFEDVPGVGKTTIIKALAKLLGLEMSRIQCTSDLLPSDILGVEVFSARKEEFVFHPGPIFSNLLFVDELNRTSPRTQSALLEAMAEGVVTINRHPHNLPSPFFVFATQNPSDQLGTYALPESQLDRFAAKVRLDYPIDSQERSIFQQSMLHPVDAISPGLFGKQWLPSLQKQAESVFAKDRVIDFMKAVVDRTRRHEELKLGVSTRGGVIWLRMSKAYAVVQGRDFVKPDDLLAMAGPCLSHRILTRSPDSNPELVIDSILKTTPIE